MDVKKSIKKVLACATASAMALCLTMPTAFAAGADGKNTEAWISKTYTTEVGKAETFSFIATQKNGDGLVSTTANVTMPTISFEQTETGTNTQRSKITFPEYTEAGKYEYTVTESENATPQVTNDDHESLIMSKAEYVMDVYVEDKANGNGVSISNIIVNKTKDDKGETATGKVDIGNTDENRFNFTNTYVQEAGTGTDPKNPVPDYTNYGSLNISKTIDANGGTADTTKQFDFTATFNFPAGTDKNTLGGVKGNGETIEIDESGNCSFKLQHNKKMKFTGLPVGTKMTVTESATPNYKGSAKVTINGVEESDLVTASKYNEAIVVSNKRLDQKKNAVDVTNTYNNVPTTGIIMNTLPYVMMIVLGGVALVGYIYLKNKKYSD